MRRKYLKLPLAFIVLWVLLQAACTGTPGSKEALRHWSYTGDTGPDYWYQLDSGYILAKEGKAQSPVDIATADLVRAEAGGKPEFHYRETGFTLENNGHTIMAVPADTGNAMILDDDRYVLQQMHFHLPGEHTVNGAAFSMEAHLVHQDAQGRIAVLGILLVPGEENPVLKELFARLPQEPEGEAYEFPDQLNLADLFPPSREMYRYDGSLTTPPCTEGVSWYIFAQPAELSKDQVDAFRAVYSGNNRPVQNLYGRKVYLTSG
jgi:carbonic anhydrase